MNAANYQDSIVFNLTIKFLSGKITFDEQQQLQLLLKEDTNKDIFEELKLSWVASGNYIDTSIQTPQDIQWEKLKQSLPEVAEKTSKTYSLNRILRVAAIWTALIVLSSLSTWLILRKNGTSKISYCTITTPLGSKMRMELQDGTIVWLNAGSTFKYPVDFSTLQRDVFLTGEAFFKVASNKKWPFVVHTKELNVKAVGTAFNVKAYPNEKAVTTTLVEGIVKLEDAEKKFSYTLKPKQELVYLTEKSASDKTVSSEADSNIAVEQNSGITRIENSVLKDEVNTNVAVSWKDKRWIIQGETIGNLAVMLERRYNIKINILSEELESFRFSGTIENETIEQVMSYLRYTIPMKYTLNKGFVDLKIDNTLKEKYNGFLKK